MSANLPDAVLCESFATVEPAEPFVTVINADFGPGARGVLKIEAADAETLALVLDHLIHRIGGTPNDVLRPLLLAQGSLSTRH